MNPLELLNGLHLHALAHLTGVARSLLLVESSSEGDSSYLTIEGMRGQEYSIGIFIFMLIGVIVFAGIIFRFVWTANRGKGLKTGEKIMFLWIIIGTFVAVVFGALQLLQGRLF